jgi:hypothetical protein
MIKQAPRDHVQPDRHAWLGSARVGRRMGLWLGGSPNDAAASEPAGVQGRCSLRSNSSTGNTWTNEEKEADDEQKSQRRSYCSPTQAVYLLPLRVSLDGGGSSSSSSSRHRLPREFYLRESLLDLPKAELRSRRSLLQLATEPRVPG